MAVTTASFKVAFPEFDLGVDATHDALVTAKLAEAEGMVDRALFVGPTSTANADSCVSYLAAHLLACSPGGLNARLAKGSTKTMYWEPYYRLIRTAAMLKNRVA